MDEHRDTGEPSGLDMISIVSPRTVYRQIPSFQQLSDTSPDLPTAATSCRSFGHRVPEREVELRQPGKVPDGLVWVIKYLR